MTFSQNDMPGEYKRSVSQRWNTLSYQDRC